MSARPDALKVGYYGDDFTGATDTLSNAARAGLKARLFLRVPTAEQLERSGPLDVLGIAGAARSMTPSEMETELAPVRDFFVQLRAPVVHYKICSTFDSAPHAGNIGAAIGVLRPLAANPLVAIVGGQPNLGRWCLFSTLYAAAGVDGAVYRIDRHPTMSRHPVTPMNEADLRRHLQAQGLQVASIEYVTYPLGQEALERAIDDRLAHRPDAVLFDVSRDADLPRIGAAIWRRAVQSRMLAIGASSVLQALIAHWREAGAGADSATRAMSIAPAAGPVLVLAGSLSPITAGQVAASRSYRRVQLDARQLASAHGADIEAIAACIAQRLRSGEHVLAVTADEHPHATTDARAISSRAVAVGCARLVREVLSRTKVGRLGIAGGDTSSHVALNSGAWALSWIGNLAEGVPVCRLHADNAAIDGLEVMLKGGQMGPPEVFEQLVRGR